MDDEKINNVLSCLYEVMKATKEIKDGRPVRPRLNTIDKATERAVNFLMGDDTPEKRIG